MLRPSLPPILPSFFPGLPEFPPSTIPSHTKKESQAALIAADIVLIRCLRRTQ